MSESEAGEIQSFSNRPMPLKEVAEQIAKLGIARARDHANRRYLMSHLRGGSLVAHGLVRLPLDKKIKIPAHTWAQISNNALKTLADFTIKFKEAAEDLNVDDVKKYEDEFKKTPKIINLKETELEDALNDVVLEICVLQHDWFKFLALPEIKQQIGKDKSSKKSDQDDKSNSHNSSKKSGREVKEGWDIAGQLLLKAFYSHFKTINDKFTDKSILDIYQSYIKIINIKGSLNNLPGDEAMKKELAFIKSDKFFEKAKKFVANLEYKMPDIEDHNVQK